MAEYMKASQRRQHIFETACDMAEVIHYRQIRRHQLSELCGTTPGNVSRVLGSMEKFRSDLVQFAIENARARVVAQAIADRHPVTESLDVAQKAQFLSAILRGGSE